MAHRGHDSRGWLLSGRPPAIPGRFAAHQPGTRWEVFACGPDPEAHIAVVRRFADAGFDHLALVNAGPDMDGFFDFFER